MALFTFVADTLVFAFALSCMYFGTHFLRRSKERVALSELLGSAQTEQAIAAGTLTRAHSVAFGLLLWAVSVFLALWLLRDLFLPK